MKWCLGNTLLAQQNACSIQKNAAMCNSDNVNDLFYIVNTTYLHLEIANPANLSLVETVLNTVSYPNLLNSDILHYLRISERIKAFLTDFWIIGKYLVIFKRAFLCFFLMGYMYKKVVLGQQMGRQSNFPDSIKIHSKHYLGQLTESIHSPLPTWLTLCIQ